MNRARTAVTILLLTVLAVTGTPPAARAQLRDSATVVNATVAPETLRAAVGDPVRLTVTMIIADGWHLYAHGDTAYYGINIAGLDSLPLAGVQVAYPAGHAGTFLGEPVTLLAGTEEAVITGYLTALPARPLHLELECQACDSKSCLAPAWLPLDVVVLPKE